MVMRALPVFCVIDNRFFGVLHFFCDFARTFDGNFQDPTDNPVRLLAFNQTPNILFTPLFYLFLFYANPTPSLSVA